MKLCLIVNPLAGGGRAMAHLGKVSMALTRLGLDHRVEVTRDLPHARDLARTAAGAGEIAVAFGGDGLFGAVADGAREAAGVLGILPGGRGNDFARTLGIPRDPVAACRVLAAGAVTRLDLGRVGTRTFVGIASCGFDSDVNRIANETRLVRGNLVYAYGALRALPAWRPVTFTVRLDDGAGCTVTGFTVAVANSSHYGGGMKLAPDASLRDGMLDVVIIHDMPKLRLLRLLPTVFSGAHVRLPAVEVARARSVEIAAARPVTMYADGDPIAELPVTVTLQPAAVRAIVPASIAGDPSRSPATAKQP